MFLVQDQTNIHKRTSKIFVKARIPVHTISFANLLLWILRTESSQSLFSIHVIRLEQNHLNNEAGQYVDSMLHISSSKNLQQRPNNQKQIPKFFANKSQMSSTKKLMIYHHCTVTVIITTEARAKVQLII